MTDDIDIKRRTARQMANRTGAPVVVFRLRDEEGEWLGHCPRHLLPAGAEIDSEIYPMEKNNDVQ